MGNISQLNKHILCSEVDDAFAVWFSVSRKFMMLEEKLFLKVDDDIIETLEADETGYLKAAVLLKFQSTVNMHLSNFPKIELHDLLLLSLKTHLTMIANAINQRAVS